MFHRPMVFVSLLCSLLGLADAYNILVVYPFPASSHNILGNAVVKHLLRAGHEITYITPYPLKDVHRNLQQIDVSSCKQSFDVAKVNIHNLMHKLVEFSDDSSVFYAVFELATAVLKSAPVQDLLHDPDKKFDVVVAEYMYNDLYSGFAAVFDCPLIWVFPYEPYVTVLKTVGEIPNPAYTPNCLSDVTPPFTFLDRVHELYGFLKSILLKELSHSYYERKVYEEVFEPVFLKKGKYLPQFDDVKNNVSMILGNTDTAIGLAQSYPPSYRNIAGFFIDENVKALPEDLQTLMDNAQDGVIYFSLGSNLKSKDLPLAIQRGLLKMFAERKEVVIWKFESKLKDLPKNVHIKKWAPQQSILAHRNCKLFITHGGLLSVTESVHFGIPFVGIPVFVDQFNNVNRMVQKGAALRADLSYSLPDDLRDAIQEISINHSLTERAKELSMIYHDRLASPGAELVHWVEHVVRTRGAPHLRSPALQLSWFQRFYLDLACVIILIIQTLKLILTRLRSNFYLRDMQNIRKKDK